MLDTRGRRVEPRSEGAACTAGGSIVRWEGAGGPASLSSASGLLVSPADNISGSGVSTLITRPLQTTE